MSSIDVISKGLAVTASTGITIIGVWFIIATATAPHRTASQIVITTLLVLALWIVVGVLWLVGLGEA